MKNQIKNIIVTSFILFISLSSFCQDSTTPSSSTIIKMTPEFLWKLGRVSGLGLTDDGKHVVYDVNTPDISENKSTHEDFVVSVDGGASIQTLSVDSVLKDKKISPDGKSILYIKAVKLVNVTGSEFYPSLPKSNVYIYNDLNYRHWDKWEDGEFDHVFIAPLVNGKQGEGKDLMADQPYDCPQKPFGGDEDYTWSPDGKYVLYVSKKKYGKEYAASTNTEIYQYAVETGATKNLSEGMMGYDISPAFSKQGTMAWLSMKTDGYESDKQDLIVMNSFGTRMNLTANRNDLQIEGFKWSDDGKKIFFWAPVKATEQLFETDINEVPVIRQITSGDFQVSDIIGQSGNTLIATRTDINHAAELYAVDITSGSMKQITHVNDNAYNTIDSCKTERRMIKTSDGLQMPTWVIYPPGFNPAKKYPTLLFCLGGPQGNTPLYSFRWNFQLMASQGYIIVAPDRRGVFGDGVKWTQDISKDWGGQAMKDYLSAIDEVSKEKYVDKNKRGCVGASYGGYSVYMLESLHDGRFKSFIAHDGLFDLKSWSGTTEELWFSNWDIGGNYWDKKNAAAQKSYDKYSPSNFVDKWNTPILIVQGGIDFRVPVEQGLQAFQAAQLRGIKSRLLYFPEENHWVLKPQNALVWQHEFFKWLDETLK